MGAVVWYSIAGAVLSIFGAMQWKGAISCALTLNVMTRHHLPYSAVMKITFCTGYLQLQVLLKTGMVT